MNQRAKQIGFSQRIRLEWLEYAANLVLAGNEKESIYEALQNLLTDKLSIGGNARRCNRDKAITIIMKIWMNVPEGLEGLRDEGLDIIKNKNRENHIVIHWGMSMAVYPFWGAVAASVGRLLRLQGTVIPSQVQRRMREKYGERETVFQAARQVLRSFVDWGLLRSTTKKGLYIAGNKRNISDPQLITWLVEASLHSHENETLPLKVILDLPSLFPFELNSITSGQFKNRKRLEIVKHRLDEDMVLLRHKV